MQGPFYEDMADCSLSPEDMQAICSDKRNDRIIAAEWQLPIEVVDKIKTDALAAKRIRPSQPTRQPKITVKVIVEVEDRQQVAKEAAASRIDNALTRPKKLHRMRIARPWDV